MADGWRDDLAAWLVPFVGMLGDRHRARMCPAYVEGLIGPGDRKSVQPMAMRSPGIGYDQRHHFIGGTLWDSAPLEEELCRQADGLVGGSDAWLIIDDTALPKKGRVSVGVGPQYGSVLGKNANCQTLVSLTLASSEVPVMIGLRLFLRESCNSDAGRMDRAKVPAEARADRTKPEIALAEIDRMRDAAVRFGGIPADAGYGLSGPFRLALTERELICAVGIPCKQKVYPADVAMIFLVAGRRRPRKNHVPDVASRPAHEMLESAKWQTVSWRRGTKGKLSARFAGIRVRVTDGPPQLIGHFGQLHLPGEEIWLVGEHRSTGDREYYLRRHTTQEAGRPSKPAGSASRPISNSRKSSALITSRGDRGRACTDMPS